MKCCMCDREAASGNYCAPCLDRECDEHVSYEDLEAASDFVQSILRGTYEENFKNGLTKEPHKV